MPAGVADQIRPTSAAPATARRRIGQASKVCQTEGLSCADGRTGSGPSTKTARNLPRSRANSDGVFTAFRRYSIVTKAERIFGPPEIGRCRQRLSGQAGVQQIGQPPARQTDLLLAQCKRRLLICGIDGARSVPPADGRDVDGRLRPLRSLPNPPRLDADNDLLRARLRHRVSRGLHLVGAVARAGDVVVDGV